MSRDDRYHKEDSGVSPIVATIVLVLATLVVGGMAFVAFRSQSTSLSKNADIETQSADLITTSSGSLFSVAVKNSGTVPMDRIEVHLSGSTKSYSSSDFSGGTHENTVSGSLKLENYYPKLRVFDNPPPSDGGGTGTPIDSVQELQGMQDNLSDNYYLTQNIDATNTKNRNGDNGFNPIGDPDRPFIGTFDGNGYIIKNLYINRGGTDDVGLFGRIRSSAIIENVKLRNVNIHGSYDVGGLVGDSYRGSQVTNCYSTGKVDGRNHVGGLVGDSYRAQVTNCYSTGEIHGSDYVGGLVGKNVETRVTNCYSTGKVHGSSKVGGLVGYGGGGSSVDNSFWGTDTSGQNSSDGGTPKTTKEMKIKSTFTNAGWDFQDVWRMGGASSGKWTSSWIDLGDAVNYLSLETTTSIPGNAEVDVRVQVSKNENKVLRETNFVKLKDGFNKINLSLPAARYARVAYKLFRGSTPVVKSYRLNCALSLTISLGPSKPGQTVSDSAEFPSGAVSAGEKKIVEITGFRENKAIIKKSITVTAHR